MHRMVAIMLIAVPILPMPDDSSDSVQKSVLCPTEKVFCSQRRMGKPPDVGRAFPAPYSPLPPKKLK